MPSDQRRALLPLLSHPNVRVRLKAAHSLIALYPDLARNALESIRRSGIEPQNGEAAMAISGLDEGSIFQGEERQRQTLVYPRAPTLAESSRDRAQAA